MDEPPPPPPPAQEDAHSVDAPPPTRSGGFVELLHEVSSGVPMEASTGQPDWLGEGMDPKSSYLLKINLLGNRKKTRKDIRCFLIEKVVDSDTTNFSDLLESVTDKYPPGYLEVAHVQYYDDENKSFPEVSSDQDLMSMFAKKCKSKIVDMFIIYRHPSEPFEPIIDWDFDDPDECESEADDNDECESDDDDGYLQNPSPDNEHVGIDEEDMYLNATEVNALDMVACSNKGKEKAYAPEDEDHVSDGDSDSGSDSEYEEVEEDEDSVGEEGNDNQCDEFDKEDPPMVVGSTYPNMSAFKLALSQHAVKREFEYKTVKSAPYRFTAICSRKHMDKCPWRIHASSLGDQRTIVVRTNPARHTCSSTRRSKKVKNATKHWVCDRVKDFLIVDGTLGPAELQKKLKEHYSLHVHYKRVYMGKELALKELYGDWDGSFNNLFRFKAQIERCCPGSIVVIDHHMVRGQIRFRRLFVALRPCIEGFLFGCRPYLAIDSTFLTGKFKGQLASATAVDGHNWLYPVCLGVFDSETNDNWIWFMSRLREAIGSPRGLTICTDAGQAVMSGVGEVFPEAEHRECMFHLVTNFKKRFHGKVFDDHLWAAAYSWNQYLFEKHWAAMDEAKPESTKYLREKHARLWTRSQFSCLSKVDYVTNNLAECFNSWIKHHKSLNIDDLMDKIRQMLMVMWNQRRKVSNKVKGVILPHIIKKLNEDSHKLALEVTECSDDVAEVTALGGIGFRFVVNLKDRTCSCRKWDVCGIPCKHALAFITSQTNARIESYADENYSVQKFRLAYAQLIPAIPDKNHWPKSTHGFFMHPPLLKATAGRPKTERFKGVGEKKKQKGQHKCPICLDYGHHWHTCKKGNPEDIVAMKELRGPPKKRAKKATTSVSSIEPMPTLALPTTMSFPPSRTPSDNGKQAGSSSLASKCQSLETTCNTKRNSRKNDSGASKRSRSGSNQPDLPPLTKDAPGPVKELNKKTRKAVAKKIKKIPLPPSDSPAMGTRSKRVELSIPAESTRSKRRLSL